MAEAGKEIRNFVMASSSRMSPRATQALDVVPNAQTIAHWPLLRTWT